MGPKATSGAQSNEWGPKQLMGPRYQQMGPKPSNIAGLATNGAKSN